MTKQEEIIKVFTQYDIPFLSIKFPFMPTLTAHSMSDDLDMADTILCDFIEYKVKSVEYGLEGVRFFHYGN